MRPYVAICVPCIGTWEAMTARALCELCMYSILVCDICVLPGEHSSPANGRNRMVLGAQELKADYILWVDADMVPPADGLARLLKHDLDMVGATYARRALPYTIMGKWEGDDKTGLKPAIHVPTGFLLTKMSVYDKISPPWFEEKIEWDKRNDNNITGTWSEDMVFCERALETGIKPYIDWSISYEIGHIGRKVVKVEK